MAKLLKLRRGTTAQHNTFTGAEGEVTIDTTKDTAVVHDGSQAGGRPLAREDMSNVSSASIAGRLGADSIATTKIAGGALPTDVTVASANIVNGTIVNADIAANAAIAGTKLENSGVTAGSYGSSSAIPIVTVDAQGLVTAASTTAIDSTKIQNGTTEVATASSGDITMKRSGTTRLVVDNAGVDVTGNLTATGNITTTGAVDAVGITIGGNTPTLNFNDANDNPDFRFLVNSNSFILEDTTNGANRFVVDSNGTASIEGNLDVGAGVDVTGNITVTGTVDGVDVANLKTAKDSLSTSNGVIKSSVSLANGVTGHTQSASDNSTKVATTAFVRSAITNYNFPSGTAMLFQQTSAPTGWTKSTTHNNKALRIVSGSASSGGSNAFTTAFGSRGISANASNTTQGGNVSVSVANSTQGGNISVGNTTAGGNLSISSVSTGGSVNSHTLSVNEMPSHSHGMTFVAARNQSRYAGGPGLSMVSYVNYQNNARQNFGSANDTVHNTGGNGGHSHGFSGSSHNHNGSLSGTAHNHNANFSGSAHNHNATGNFSGSAHNHSISVGNLDMAVQYVDVIIATKD